MPQEFSDFDNIQEIVRLIPEGKVTTYGAIAKCLSISPRTVVWAIRKSSTTPIPAHRVVNRNGELTGSRAFENPSMETRLTNENIVIEKNSVKNFESYFWDPLTQLS